MTATRSATSRATIFGGAALLGTWAILLILLCFTPIRSLLPAAVGMRIESLGQFGDAFAPVTAFFALIAAVGAWRSYEAQREQLADERERAHVDQFNDLFFRLIAYYKEELDRVLYQQETRTMNASAMIDVTVRNTISKLWDLWAQTPGDANLRHFWDVQLYEIDGQYDVLGPLAMQVPATLRILQASRLQSVEIHGRLLKARLSHSERWFWQCAIAATNDHRLIDFANEMDLFGIVASEVGYERRTVGLSLDDAQLFGSEHPEQG